MVEELDQFKAKSLRLLTWSEDMIQMLRAGYSLEDIQVETAAWKLWEEAIEEMRKLWDEYK